MIPLVKIENQFSGLINEYAKEINDVWERDDKVNIRISIKLSIKAGKNNCESAIAFTKAKVQSKLAFTWDDKQTELTLPKKEKVKNGEG